MGRALASIRHNLVLWWSECLKEKHPEVWHEVAGNAIIWIVEQYFHLPSPGFHYQSLFICADRAKGQEEEGKTRSKCQSRLFALRCTIPHMCATTHKVSRLVCWLMYAGKHSNREPLCPFAHRLVTAEYNSDKGNGCVMFPMAEFVGVNRC